MGFEVKIKYLDVSAALASRQQPHVLYPRPKARQESVAGQRVFSTDTGPCGVYWAAMTSLNGQQAIEWSECNHGDYVRIPIHAYQTEVDAKSVLVACGGELVGRAMYDLALQRREALQVIFIVGNRVNRVEGGFQYYLGLAVRVG